MKLSSKPRKAQNLKIIDHIGTLYATFNGTSIWRIDRVAFGILRLCDGKRSVRGIIEGVAKKAGLEPRHVRKIVLEILEDLKRKKFIKVK